jgi:hypothetical protein
MTEERIDDKQWPRVVAVRAEERNRFPNRSGAAFVEPSPADTRAERSGTAEPDAEHPVIGGVRHIYGVDSGMAGGARMLWRPSTVAHLENVINRTQGQASSLGLGGDHDANDGHDKCYERDHGQCHGDLHQCLRHRYQARLAGRRIFLPDRRCLCGRNSHIAHPLDRSQVRPRHFDRCQFPLDPLPCSRAAVSTARRCSWVSASNSRSASSFLAASRSSATR